MRCSELTVWLSDYADDVVDERARRIVERHLQLCASCRGELQVLRLIAHDLQRANLLPAAVLARLPRLQREVESRLADQAQTRRRWPWLVLAGLSILLFEGAALWLIVTLLHG